MQDGQFDLFDSAGVRHDAPLSSQQPHPETTPAADMTDAALIAAIPDAGLAACEALAGEAARRKLVAAVPETGSVVPPVQGLRTAPPHP